MKFLIVKPCPLPIFISLGSKYSPQDTISLYIVISSWSQQERNEVNCITVFLFVTWVWNSVYEVFYPKWPKLDDSCKLFSFNLLEVTSNIEQSLYFEIVHFCLSYLVEVGNLSVENHIKTLQTGKFCKLSCQFSNYFSPVGVVHTVLCLLCGCFKLLL